VRFVSSWDFATSLSVSVSSSNDDSTLRAVRTDSARGDLRPVKEGLGTRLTIGARTLLLP
jgi:hypothetical protein